MAWLTIGPLWLAGGCYALGVGSAVLPWLNAELLLLSALSLTSSLPATLAVVVAITAGQMTGKTAVYLTARRVGGGKSVRVKVALDRWRRLVEARPAAALGLVFVSAVVGMPPFYVVSLAAGATGMALRRFLVVGTCGRLLHFSAVACLPDVIRRIS